MFVSFGQGQESKEEVFQNLSKFFLEVTYIKCLFEYSICPDDWPIGQLC